mmetsp:Transcript_2538/g.4836  ORF Transcript_2538/g.4836 Transcript_2538/m.4836 type:complete len:169 (+) Transcript_2538:480-986(+)
MSEENESFAKNNSQLEKEVKGLWKDVGIVDTATADLDKILDGFDTLMDTASLMEKFEKKLNEEQNKFLQYQRQRLLSNAKHQMQRRLRDTFDDVDIDNSGSIMGKETGVLKRILKRDLPEVKDIDKIFDVDGDGKIKKWELMDACDKVLDQTYSVDYEKKNGKIQSVK